MKKFHFLIWALLFVLFSTACSEDRLDEVGPSVRPIDAFVGDFQKLVLQEGCDAFTGNRFTLYIATPEGEVIRRTGRYQRPGNQYTHMCLI